jgi:cytochrome c oxidase subunit 2
MFEDPWERRWIYVSLSLIGVFLAGILYTALARGIFPPSTVETVDSASLHLSEEFAEDRLGVRTAADSSLTVTLVAARYGFHPRQIELPSDTPVTFRIASADVLHGAHVPMTNMSTMIMPGYVAQVTTVFPEPGEYPMLCNEYCGLGHDHMWGKVVIVAKESWPAATK